MTTTDSQSPAEVLRSEFEKIGWSVEGLPDGLTWEQALDLAQAVEREFTRSYLPEMAARLDEGDVGGAAREFLLHLGEDVD